MLSLSPAPSARKPQHGLSLVELMVGMAIGLFIVAAGVLGVTTSLQENRQLLLEARLQQDLRATMDLITRDVRRAGYWGTPASGIPTPAAAATANPHAAITAGTPPTRPTIVLSTAPATNTATTAADSLTYRWDADEDGTLDSNETYAFRLSDGKIQLSIGGGTWQDVTDSGTMVVTAFSVTPTLTWLPLYDKCNNACNPTTQSCPEMVMRTLAIAISARSLDSTVQRTLRSNVRVRNDQLVNSCP